MNVREFLRKVHLFANLSEKNLKRVERLCKTRSYRAGEHIVSQGGWGEGLFVITSGKVRIVKKTNDGTELEIATHGPGEFFGEFSVLDGAPRSADVVAAECYYRALAYVEGEDETTGRRILEAIVLLFPDTSWGKRADEQLEGMRLTEGAEEEAPASRPVPVDGSDAGD